MKILELRFENLNSLVGHWQIDLEQPEFVSDGIFAITGPTGAGKTTILDAICLALYGATPRLGRLGKGSNELMSRQTGHCFAQVVFETRTGRYISQWSQHRARKKAGAELQAPRHEISDTTNGKILSSSVKESAALIVELTGMSFEQFTRSMMLAQGAFAAFLQAKSDERAPILEQITGTEIYSEISMLVHQHRGEQERRLQALQQQLDGRVVLSEEQRAGLQQQLESLQAQVQALQSEQSCVRTQWLTYQQLQENAQQLQHHQQRHQQHQQRRADFEADRQRLLLARRTLAVMADFRALEQTRQDQQSDQTRLRSLQEQLPQTQQRLAAAQQAVQTQQTHWQQQRAEYERMQPVLEQVRGLDAQIAQQRSVQATLQRNENEAQVHQQRQQKELQGLTQQHQQATQTLAALQTKLQQCSRDAGLQGALSGLLQEIDVWVALDQALEQSTQQQREADRRVEQAQLAAAQLDTRWQQAQQQHQGLQARQQHHEQALQTCLQGRRLPDWQQHYNQLLGRQQVCQQALDNWQQMTSLTAALATDQQTLQDLQQRTQQLDLAIAQLQHEVSLQQTQMEHLRQQETLQRRIETYEQARAHLHDGQPCPLCGALEHPFAHGQSGSMDQLQQQMQACQQALTRLERALAQQQLERGKVVYQREDLEQRQRTRQAELQACQRAQPGLLDELGVTLIPVNQTVGEVLDLLQAQLGPQRQQVQQLLEDAGQLTLEWQRSSQAVQRSGEDLQQLQSQWHQARQQSEHARLQAEQLQQTRQNQVQQRDALQARLVADLLPYGVMQAVFAQRDHVLALKQQLRQRRDEWLDLQASEQQARQALPKLEQSSQYVQEQLQLKAADLQRLQQELTQRQQQIVQLQQQRDNLLASEDPAAVARRLEQAVELARHTVEQAREQAAQAQLTHQQLLDRQTSLQEAIGQRQQRLQQLQDTLDAGLQAQGFASEAALQAAILTDAQRQPLELQEQQLLEEKSALDAEKTTLLREQTRLTALVDTSQPMAVLEPQLRDLEQRVQQATEQSGSLRQRLRDDDLARLESASVWEQLQKQQAVFEQWNTLHALIGSADGKKFRTFAQGLTFDVVLQHANHQLQRMTDRYVLVRGDSEPLALNVIDQYQAAEVRTTKNLSGGESFLVSLALALGLSSMASRKIRVDSLFLDEGFGTLDEDALDMALQTLSSLHQEGKLIGVISHVQALKDRIATQIQVVPARGGRSVLQGPGCVRLGTENS